MHHITRSSYNLEYLYYRISTPQDVVAREKALLKLSGCCAPGGRFSGYELLYPWPLRPLCFGARQDTGMLHAGWKPNSRGFTPPTSAPGPARAEWPSGSAPAKAPDFATRHRRQRGRPSDLPVGHVRRFLTGADLARGRRAASCGWTAK